MTLLIIAALVSTTPMSAKAVHLNCRAEQASPVRDKNGKWAVRTSSFPINYVIDEAGKSVTVKAATGDIKTVDADAKGSSVRIYEGGVEMITTTNFLAGGFVQKGKLHISSDWTEGSVEQEMYRNGIMVHTRHLTLSCSIQSE